MKRDLYNIPSIFFGSNLEVIMFLKDKNTPSKFKELRNIQNPNTNRKYSSSTIAKSVKDLEEKKIIINEIKIENKKKIIGYSLTDKGKKILDIINETENEIKKLEKQ